MYSIDNLLGKLIWKYDKVNLQNIFTLDKDKKTLFCKGKSGRIYLINSETGKIEREVKFDGQFSNSSTDIVAVNGNFIFTNNGSMYKSINNTKYELIYYNDYSPFSLLYRIDKERFIASRYDGSVIIFSLR